MQRTVALRFQNASVTVKPLLSYACSQQPLNPGAWGAGVGQIVPRSALGIGAHRKRGAGIHGFPRHRATKHGLLTRAALVFFSKNVSPSRPIMVIRCDDLCNIRVDIQPGPKACRGNTRIPDSIKSPVGCQGFFGRDFFKFLAALASNCVAGGEVVR